MRSLQFLLLYIPLIASTINPYRLPTTIKPIKYDITLAPNFTDFTFKGHQQISINISSNHFNKTTSNPNDPLIIKMHIGPQIKIINISLYIDGFNQSNITDNILSNQSYNNITQIISFQFDIVYHQIMDLMATNNGEYISALMNLQFNGILREDMKGFYISQYQYENSTIYNAVTQFESTDARRAFPCFDEPSFKAQFKITMIAPVICTVLSNMNVKQIISMDNTNECTYIAPISMGGINTQCKMVQFEVSPAMSTYLVAFAVGLYHNVTDYTINGLKTSIYFPIDSDANHARYALDVALQILPYYEQLFGVKFPLPKMDCIALSDFALGAMENWGLVTYRRTALLVDPEVSSKSALQRVVVVIAHEFAHQWFGDIVTMRWWDDLWLNEGFASFVEYIGSNYSNPELEIWDFFLISMNSVLIIDSSYYTHPIELFVSDPNEIDTLFDSVTYNKGMSVIRMLYIFMGSQQFMNGIESYLKTHIYNNADTQQLWDALGGDNIINMMNSWVLTPGYPVLNVTIKYIDDNIKNDIIFNVEQKRMIKQGPDFYINPNFDDKYSLKYDTDLVYNNYSKQIWEIPLKIELIDGSIEYIDNIMKRSNNTLSVSRINSNDNNEYYIFNKDQSGFFRVLYDKQSFEFIINSWLNDYLSDFDKFSLLSDQYAFMLSNYISGTEYLQFLTKISGKEAINPSFLIWDSIINALFTIDSLFCEKHNDDEKNVLIHFRTYAINIISPTWTSIGGWNISISDSENIINLRALLINAMVRFNDYDTIFYGYNIFLNIIINDKIVINDNGEIEGIDTNILKQVIECALSYEARNDGIGHLLIEFKSIYNNLNSEYQRYVLGGIGAVYLNTELTVQALDFILKSDSVRNQDKLRGLYSLRRCYGREEVWGYLIENGFWESLFSIYGSGFSAQDITEIPNKFASKSYYENVYNFYYKKNGHKTSSNERSVNETLENIQINTEWIKNNYYDIADYLIKQLFNESNNELSKYNELNYIWIIILILIILFCLTFGFRWIWKKKLSKTKMFMYQRQIDHDNGSDTKAMINNENENNYKITMTSIHHHHDDNNNDNDNDNDNDGINQSDDDDDRL